MVKRNRKLANQIKKEGWKLQTDHPGYDQPEPIGKEKRIPDILAKKAGAERIIEVQTQETMQSDDAQHSTFKRRATQKPRTKFEIEKA